MESSPKSELYQESPAYPVPAPLNVPSDFAVQSTYEVPTASVDPTPLDVPSTSIAPSPFDVPSTSFAPSPLDVHTTSSTPPSTDIRSIKKKRDSNNSQAEDFKDCILRTINALNPQAKLDPLILKEMESFVLHMTETFDKELIRLGKMRKGKTLTVRELETATKLCFPKLLADSAVAYGRRALEMLKSPSEELDE